MLAARAAGSEQPGARRIAGSAPDPADDAVTAATRPASTWALPITSMALPPGRTEARARALDRQPGDPPQPAPRQRRAPAACPQAGADARHPPHAPTAAKTGRTRSYGTTSRAPAHALEPRAGHPEPAPSLPERPETHACQETIHQALNVQGAGSVTRTDEGAARRSRHAQPAPPRPPAPARHSTPWS